MAAQNELGLHFAFFLHAVFRGLSGEIGLSISSHHLQPSPIGTVDVLKLHVKNRVYPMLARQKAKAVLPSISGKHGAVMMPVLPVQIDLRCPPSLQAIFKLGHAAPEPI